MTPFALLAYVPLLAVTTAVGFTALRLSRNVAVGLVSLCFAQATWVLALCLLESGYAEADRFLPSGMLLAGAYVHIASELAGEHQKSARRWGWSFGLAVALLGALAPRLFYGPGAREPGPLFPALALVSFVATLLVQAYLLRLALRAPSANERRRRLILLAANVLGALGGGGAIALHVLGWAESSVAAPFLLPSVLLAAYAVWSSEAGRGRDRILQGFVHALCTALFSCVALVSFAVLLPSLVPDGRLLSLWSVLVAFSAALALDPLRLWVVEGLLGWLFRDPIAIRTLTRRAEEARERADHAQRLAEVGLLVSAVAHEVRNPLGVMLAELKLLERSGADAESIVALREQVARANRFVDDLLAWSKPRALAPSSVDAARLAMRAAEHATRGLGFAHVPEVISTLSSPEFEADERAVEDVLQNLLQNALIATAGAAGAVRLVLSERGSELCFTVEDDGPGVPKELEPRLFQVFATGRGRDARHPGTGLGLATSARLVARHGGALWHEPREGASGARFVASFPRRARIDV